MWPARQPSTTASNAASGLTPTVVQVCCGQAQLGGEVGQEHQVLWCPVGMAGPLVNLPVRLGDLVVQQGGGGDHQYAAGLGRDLGERLIEQDAEVAVGDPAGLELLAVGVGTKPPHLYSSFGIGTPGTRLPGRCGAVPTQPS
jgi:hypothetical protein